MVKIDDVTPVILAGRADDERSVPEESQHEVHDVAQIGLWRGDGQYDLDIDKILGLDLDVIHVQYQSMLFNQPPLERLTGAFDGPTAITFHDNCQRPDFPYWAFDMHFTHRWNVGPPSAECIQFGIELRPSVVRTFGLGRTRSDYIKLICDRNGWVFEDIASHEPIHGGGQRWRTHPDLIEWLRGADVIVLWYDPQPAAGSSQAARTAMASRRLVVTNDTEWFSDLPDTPVPGIYRKVSTLEELEVVLHDILVPPRYLIENSLDHVVRHLVGCYELASVTT
jgi:hypothetical protein